MLLKLQITKPKEFIEQHLGKGSGQHLVNFFVSNLIVHQLEG